MVSPARKSLRGFLKQPMMVRVLYALAPLFVAGVYFFGWRVLALVAVCSLGGLATERLMASRRGAPVSMACFVTCGIYALSLPPTLPFWMALVGIVVAILFGKEVFGGFGRNFANPAIVGRTFVYVAFPAPMTARFVPALRGWPGGFGCWSPATMDPVPEWLRTAATRSMDVVTSATPMWARRDLAYETPLGDLFLGNIGGAFQGGFGAKVLAAGSIGEVSALLIVLAGVYLIATRTANWRLTVSALGGAVLANLFLRCAAGATGVPPLLFTLCSGALLFAAVFMVTDPVSAPKKRPSMYLYGILVGVLIVFLRWKAQFSGAVGFAILLGNICAPSFDMAVTAWGDRSKVAPAETAGTGGV